MFRYFLIEFYERNLLCRSNWKLLIESSANYNRSVKHYSCSNLENDFPIESYFLPVIYYSYRKKFHFRDIFAIFVVNNLKLNNFDSTNHN